jgi:hypothetical protein
MRRILTAAGTRVKTATVEAEPETEGVAAMTEQRDSPLNLLSGEPAGRIGSPWRTAGLIGFCAAALACFFIGCAPREQRYEPQMAGIYDRWAREADRFAYVDELGAGTALGRFLLVRGGEEFCAVRFTGWRRGRNAVTDWFFFSADEDTVAEYEWFYQGDGSGDFKKPNVQSGTGKVFFRGVSGAAYVDCGPFRLPWVYPNRVQFTRVNWTGSRDPVEFAPTGWDQLAELDPASERLHWYGFDLERYQRRPIPVDELK